MNPRKRASTPSLKLSKAPIVEAVVDIDCDLPPTLDLAALEAPARRTFGDRYPKFRKQFMQQLEFELSASDPPKQSSRQGIQALQFLQEDEKQLVQVRAEGFSFNRLVPYSHLDDYLPEIERTWHLFCNVTSPVHVRLLRLRYINRIPLPTKKGRVELSEYFRVGPRLPDERRLTLTGFLDHRAAIEEATGNHVNIVLTAQPVEAKALPIIFDIESTRAVELKPDDWNEIVTIIQSLRTLKNRVFRNTLTPRCMDLLR